MAFLQVQFSHARKGLKYNTENPYFLDFKFKVQAQVLGKTQNIMWLYNTLEKFVYFLSFVT